MDLLRWSSLRNVFVFSGSGVLQSLKEEFPETHMGSWGSVLWFTDYVKLRGFPSRPPNSPSPSSHHGKGPELSSGGPGWSHCPESLLHIKAQSSPASAHLVCIPSCSPLLCFGNQAPSRRPRATRPWPWSEQVCALCRCCRLVEREHLTLFPGGYIWELGVGMDRVLSQNDQSTF